MNVLEKILEEVKEIEKKFVVGHEVLFALGATGMATEIEEIIRSHMGEVSDENNKWIPVTKQLPEENEKYKGRKVIDVLVTTARGNVTKVQRQSHNDTWWWGRIYGQPTAWQPLPEPYRGE